MPAALSGIDLGDSRPTTSSGTRAGRTVPVVELGYLLAGYDGCVLSTPSLRRSGMSDPHGMMRGMVIQRAYRFALEPTPRQERMLRSHAGASRFAWNWGLAKCMERYAAEGKWYSWIDLQNLWNAVKKQDEALAWWSENATKEEMTL